MQDQTTKLPAIGMSIVANIGGDRQITLQTYYERDEPIEAVNALVDRMQAVTDRQEAKYKLVGVLENLKIHLKTLERLEEDLAAVDANHDKKQAERQLQLDEMLSMAHEQIATAEKQMNAEAANGLRARDSRWAEAEGKFRETGRKGVFKPDGHVRQNLDVLDAEIKRVNETNANRLQQLKDDLARLISDKEFEISNGDAERDSTRAQMEVARNRHGQEVEALTRDKDKYEALIG